LRVALAAAPVEEFSLTDGRGVCIYSSSEDVASAIVAETAAEARAAIAEKGAFSLCVPGGFGPDENAVGGGASFVAEALAGLSKADGLDFSRFHVFFCGERLDHEDTYVSARKAWIDACGIPLDQVHAVPPGAFAEGVAAQYTATICMQEEEVISDSPTGLPAVDLMLLDASDDGTVGRLRPDSDEMREVGSEKVVLPVERRGEEAVALSMDFLNASRRAIVAAPAGCSAEHRRTMVSVALGGVDAGAACPAGLVHAQRTTWLVEADAATAIPRP